MPCGHGAAIGASAPSDDDTSRGGAVRHSRAKSHRPFVLFVFTYIEGMARIRTIHEPLCAPERAAARDALERLRVGGALCVEEGTSSYVLPDLVAREVMTLLEAFAEGRTPLVSTSEEEVGTQEAADFLNLSRPTVVRMMDDGRIPFRKPGKHRRVRLADLMALEVQMTHDRQTAIDEISALGQEAIRQARAQGNFTEDMM